jgi:hypothetical protein
MKKTKNTTRRLSVRLASCDYDTMKCRAFAAHRSVSDFTRLMLALALEATRDNPGIGLPTPNDSRWRTQ